MIRYIDSHAHLTSDELYPQADAIMERAETTGMRALINICTQTDHLEKTALMQTLYPKKIFCAAAVHPHDTEEKENTFFSKVFEAAHAKKLVAIGETGLDYHYTFASKEAQLASLSKHVGLALAASLPLIIHCREAFSDIFSHIDKSAKTLVHCFTGSIEEAKQALDNGWMLSFSGVITFKKSELLREVLRYIPLDRMLMETDAPYLAPQSKRGKLNEPSFLPETLLTISSTKGLSIEETAETLYKNTIAFFSLSL